ncbi:MAG TPA: VOC family protein [Actinomycetota bacterium]|jgi:hypothetical protein
MELDHVILGAANLEETGRRLEKEGLASVVGGRHADWGTANRIVPLGSSYLEIVGVVDQQLAAGTSYGNHVQEQTKHGDRLIGWCLRVDDLDETASRLGLEMTPGARTLPDGGRVAWRTVGVERALGSGYLPFFISWDVPANHHPGRMPSVHPVEVIGELSVEVRGNAVELEDWLGRSIPPWIEVREGAPAVIAVRIPTVSGDALVRSV